MYQGSISDYEKKDHNLDTIVDLIKTTQNSLANLDPYYFAIN